MATLELPQAAPAQQETTGGAGASDSVAIHPYLYPWQPLKTPASSGLRKALSKLVEKGGQKEGDQFIQALEQTRKSLATALESASVSEAGVSQALTAYCGLLLGLVSSSAAGSGGAGAAAQGAAASPDEALAAAERGSGSSLAGTPSKLRHAVRWEWPDVVVSPAPGALPRKAASDDSAFELGSVLLAAALRLMHAAAQAALDSPSGVPTAASARAYKVLREAAGMLEYVAAQVLPLLPQGVAADCDAQVVRALASTALAEAQQLTLLRAVSKGNQAQLIAALAADTAALYSQACSQLAASSAPGAGSSKLLQYGQYKRAYCTAYAHCFNGIRMWRQDMCGDGLKSMQEAAAQLAAAKKAAAGYDAAPPATLNLHHRRVDEELERVIADSQRRMQRENDAVYLQRLPAEVPALPEGQRLVSSLPFALPPAAPAVQEGVVDRCFAAGPAAAPRPPTQAPVPAEMKAGAAAGVAGAAAGMGGPAVAAAAGGKQEGGCSCCRWLVFILVAPVLAALWLLGAVIWLLLLPLKCCCPCCGFPLQWAADLVLWLMRLPARAMLWAVGGAPWEDSGKDGKAGKEQDGGQ